MADNRRQHGTVHPLPPVSFSKEAETHPGTEAVSIGDPHEGEKEYSANKWRL